MNVERAKDLAAQAALEAYATTLVKLMGEDDLQLDLLLRLTRHVHVAVLVDSTTGEAVAVRAEWTFTGDEAAVAEILKSRPAGAG